MTHHTVTIRWSAEDEAFIAEVPELAGCAADGPTRQEALANVEVIIEEWLEADATRSVVKREEESMTQTYEAELRGDMIRSFTRHTTKAAARAAIHEAHNPVLVELLGGGYDAFPQGHPLPAGAEIIERCVLTARGMKWQKEVSTGA